MLTTPAIPRAAPCGSFTARCTAAAAFFGFGAKLLAVLFSLATILSSVSGGNMFQAWNVAGLSEHYFGIPKLGAGIALAVIVALVIPGRRQAQSEPSPASSSP